MQIDASAETLLLDDDEDLKFFREVYKKYESSNFLVVAYSPKKDLLAKETLDDIKNLSNELLRVENIQKIDSILTVPLISSSAKMITELLNGVKTLENSNDIDKNSIKNEFLNSPLYKNALVSSDFKTTAIILHLKNNETFSKLLNKRNALLLKQKSSPLSGDEKLELDRTIGEFKALREDLRVKETLYISKIREIISKHKNNATIFLGGVNMIASDVVGFVKNDLLIYGLSLALLFILVLWYIFRRLRWIVITLFICTISIISTAGVLGYFDWEVTVISSNFVALELIITMSIVVHLIERYRELFFKYPKATQYKLVSNAVLSKLIPSFFAITTTVVGFASLVLSHIEPVINLGLMMSVGILISLVETFLFFPVILMLLGKKDEFLPPKSSLSFIEATPKIVLQYGKVIVVVAILVAIFSIVGSMKIFVENSFINYFKSSTHIYQGMKAIDEHLGGTTPLDIIIKFKKDDKVVQKDSSKSDSFDDFEDEYASSGDENQYWFSKDKIDLITKIHNYLETLPEIGKVQSLASLLKIGKELNNGKDLDSITLALFYTQLPDNYKKLIISPFVNIEANEARITMRIVDSNEHLRRNELLKKIQNDVESMIKNQDTTIRLSNLMVLYNNMLQSLFESQIATAGASIAVLAVMFLILFRNIKMVFIALVTNLIPISLVFGIMGYLGIPLDIMTITIAAIALGIAVDDTIHFMHRFDFEYKQNAFSYSSAIVNSLHTVGHPMYHTTIIIVIGFSVLMLSNLVPTIYFGLLTGVVMISVLVSNLLLLPRLLVLIKPFGKS